MRMRLPRVRLTLRRMMIGVALAAVIASIAARYETGRRAFHYRVLADQHAESERQFLDFIETIRMTSLAPTDRSSQLMAKYRQTAAHFAQMRVKYERAARYPWLPVPPDPPPPD